MPAFSLPPLSGATLADGTPVAPGQAVVPVLVVVDADNKAAMSRGHVVEVVDAVPPTGFSGLAAGGATATTIEVSWDAGLADAVDAAPDVVVGCYTADETLTAAQVIAQAGTGHVATATVADGSATRSVTFEGLAQGTAHYFHAVARDAAGNTTAVLRAGGSTAASTSTTWEFFVSVASDDQLSAPIMTEIAASTFDIQEADVAFNPGLGLSVVNGATLAGAVTNGSTATGDGYVAGTLSNLSVGTLFFTVTQPLGEQPLWAITFVRPRYRPGLRIMRNGTLWYEDAANGGTSLTPTPETVLYSAAV